MVKRTKLFVLTLAITVVSILPFSINIWAFTTYTWQDPITGGKIDVTPIIGYANKIWIYEVKNINYNPGYGVNFFAINPYPQGTSLWVNSMRLPGPGWVGGIDLELVPPYSLVPPPGNSTQLTWYTQNAQTPGILPGSTGVFSFKTNPVGIDFVPLWGFAGWATNTLGFFGDVFVPSPNKAPEIMAKITAVNGTVTITTPSGTNPASVGTIIYSGDVVKTGPNSSADVGFADGSYVELRENSEFTIGGKAGETIFLDELGKIYNKLLNPGYQFRTPGTGGSVRGTEFWIDANEITTTVSVLSGTVEVADLTGGVLGSITDVPEGTSFTVNPVPEPTTILLLGSGLIGLAGYGRRKFFKK